MKDEQEIQIEWVCVAEEKETTLRMSGSQWDPVFEKMEETKRRRLQISDVSICRRNLKSNGVFLGRQPWTSAGPMGISKFVEEISEKT